MNEINETFDNLILQLNNRRQTLLDKVRALTEEMTARKTQMKSQVEDLTSMQASIQVKLRYNEMRDVQERMLAEVNQQLSKLEMSNENEYLSFNFSGEKFEEAIISFGSIVKRIIPNYSNMKQPIIAVGKHGDQPGEINKPYGVAFCEESNQIFIADKLAACVHIFSEKGMFEKRIGEGTLKFPWGVAVYKNSLYVIDRTLHAIILYRLPECTLVKSVTSFSLGVLNWKFYSLRGITVSNNGDVF